MPTQNTKLKKCKQQSTHVDGLVVHAAEKMRLIQGKDDVLLLDGGFFWPNCADHKQQPGVNNTHFLASNNHHDNRDAVD